MKKAAIPLSSERLEVRLTPAEKKYLRLKAAKAGYLSMADFIVASVKGITMHDSRYDKSICDMLDKVALELNKVGVNINQAVHAINIQRLTGTFNVENINAFTTIVEEFNEKQEMLFNLLKKIRFE